MLAVLLGGCNLGARTFAFSFPEREGVETLTVVLLDGSGNVVSVDAAPDDFVPLVDDGISNVVGRPNAVVIHWLGGACDTNVAIDAASTSGNLEFTVTVTTRPGGCRLVGIPRAVLIELSVPADMNRIGVRFEP